MNLQNSYFCHAGGSGNLTERNMFRNPPSKRSVFSSNATITSNSELSSVSNFSSNSGFSSHSVSQARYIMKGGSQEYKDKELLSPSYQSNPPTLTRAQRKRLGKLRAKNRMAEWMSPEKVNNNQTGNERDFKNRLTSSSGYPVNVPGKRMVVSFEPPNKMSDFECRDSRYNSDIAGTSNSYNIQARNFGHLSDFAAVDREQNYQFGITNTYLSGRFDDSSSRNSRQDVQRASEHLRQSPDHFLPSSESLRTSDTEKNYYLNSRNALRDSNLSDSRQNDFYRNDGSSQYRTDFSGNHRETRQSSCFTSGEPRSFCSLKEAELDCRFSARPVDLGPHGYRNDADGRSRLSGRVGSQDFDLRSSNVLPRNTSDSAISEDLRRDDLCINDLKHYKTKLTSWPCGNARERDEKNRDTTTELGLNAKPIIIKAQKIKLSDGFRPGPQQGNKVGTPGRNKKNRKRKKPKKLAADSFSGTVNPTGLPKQIPPNVMRKAIFSRLRKQEKCASKKVETLKELLQSSKSLLDTVGTSESDGSDHPSKSANETDYVDNFEQKGFSEGVSKVAIISKDYPRNRISVFQSVKLKRSLTKLMTECEEPEFPQFAASYLKKGVLVVVCMNEFSENWLENALKKVVLDEVTFSKGDYKSIFESVRFVFKTPKVIMSLEPEAILKLISKQNNGVNTDGWQIVNCSKENNGQTVEIMIPKKGEDELKVREYKLFLGLVQLELKKKTLNKKERFFKIKRKSLKNKPL